MPEIDNNIRRLRFDHGEMTKICARARQQGMRVHLDGARLYIASAYTGISPADYAKPFDTVYVSLWKYFNSLNGAILAGPKDVLDGMFHTRRMFGGALFNAWPFALLARHYANGYLDHMKSAIAVSEAFIQGIDGKGVRVERIPNGSNVFRLVVPGDKAEILRQRLADQGVMLPQPGKTDEGMVFWLQVNESWNRTTGEKLVDQFSSALRN